jgi:hypothetical protein
MSTLADFSVEELRTLIGEVVEQKLLEMLGDPDEGLTLRPEVQERLRKSLNQSKESRQAISAPEAARNLGLEW